MKPIPTSLEHTVLPPEQSASSRHPTLILLHGRGADEEDLLGLSRYFDPRFLVLSVRAPYPFLSSGGYTWYEFNAVGLPEPQMFRTSYEKLEVFLGDALAHYPVHTGRVFLLGFSMGTVMSYALSLTKPALFRGVVANSGYVPEGTHLSFAWKKLGALEFLITHGTHDPVIPIELARRAKELMQEAGAAYEYREYAMGHQMSEESLQDIAGWLHQRIENME